MVRIILSGGRWRKPVQVTGPAVPRVGWAGPHRIKNLPLLRGWGEQNWSPRSCACSWQPKVYCQNTFKNKVNGCQKRPDSWAVASGRWMGSGQLWEKVTTAPLDSRAPSVSASVPPFAEPNRSALLPNIPSLPHPSAYSPVCQPFCYLETVFVLLWIVFFFFFQKKPSHCLLSSGGRVSSGCHCPAGARGHCAFKSSQSPQRGVPLPGRGDLSIRQ